MLNVPITNVPIQSFSIQLEQNQYDIVIRLCAASTRTPPYYDDGVIAMDIVRDQVPIVTGQRCVPGTPCIPYPYLQVGNFVWVTENGDLLDFTQFNNTQFLLYVMADELADINAGA